MKKITAILFCLLVKFAFCQQKNELVINAKRNDDNSVSINYTKTNPGSYVVRLKLNNLENTYASSEIIETIKGYSGNIITLTPNDENRGIGYGYSYSYLKGCKENKAEKDFVYLLPYEENTTAKMRNLTNLEESYFDGKSIESWKAFQFLFDKETPVHAIRKGIVVDIVDNYESQEKDGIMYSSKNNHLLIEHEDGTLGHYSVLRKGSIKVAIGDKVYPYTLLATSGKYGTEEDFQVRLMIYYLTKLKFREYGDKITYKNKFNNYSYIDPVFYLDGKSSKLPVFVII